MAESARIEMLFKGGDQLAKLSGDLKQAADGKELRRDLLKNFRRAGRPTVMDVRRAVMANPSKNLPGGSTAHQGGVGLRVAIARATGSSISATARGASIRIRVNAKKVKPGTLPKYMDGELGAFSRWRSPNWGRDEFKQQPSHPYFFRTVRSHADEFRQACLDAMDGTAAKLAGG